MARAAPRVEGARLIRSDMPGAEVAVETPDWFAWLEAATVFTFVGPQGQFTAQGAPQRRRLVLWKAYRRQGGTLQCAYLGRSADLTLARLHAAAAALAQASPAGPGCRLVGRPRRAPYD